MCLIITSKTGRPKEEYIRNGFSNHPDGTGIAWYENDEVHYKKGLTLEETIKMSAELPVGFTIHFRWASVGGKDKSLIHPFPVKKDVPLLDEGKAKSVLFHNGHWEAWNNVLVNHLTSRITLPKGKWSDTRAIAFLVSVHGANFLKLIESSGRFIIMQDNKTYAYGNFEEEDGVFYSNNSYKSHIRGGCGTGVSNTPNRTTTSVGSTPWSHRQPISQPSQPLLTPKAKAQVVASPDERESLTAAEYEELQAYFEKDLGQPSTVGV